MPLVKFRTYNLIMKLLNYSLRYADMLNMDIGEQIGRAFSVTE